MGKLIRLELNNFKSYKGHHALHFGDSYFTSIIGPNGSGKSNSMDAISFVLGIRSSDLRSSHLKELVYRGRVLKTSKINDDGSAAAPAANGASHGNGNASSEVEMEDVDDQPGERNDPKSAWVMAVYLDENREEQKWKRSITPQGTSVYHVNGRPVSAQKYHDTLEAENILIKARNFLVFQGDVETISTKSPEDLTKLIEQISGSLELKPEYDRLEREADEATENQNYHLQRRRGINSEVKQWQEQKKEAENFESKVADRDNAIVQHVLWKLYHFQRVMEESGAEIQRHQEELKEFRRGVEKYEKNLEDARKEQSKVQRDVSKVERNMKSKEKEIEDTENALVPVDQKIEQSLKDMEKLQKRVDGIVKQRDEQLSNVASLKKEVQTVQKARDRFEADFAESMKKQGKQLSMADLKEYNKLRSQVISQTSANQAKLDNLVRQLKIDEITVNSLKSKVDASQVQVDKLTEELRLVNNRKQSTEELVQSISEEVDEKKKTFTNLQSERRRTNQKRTQLEEKLQEVLKKLAEATDGRRQNEKEQRTKEMVTSLKRIIPGVRGRIGELCKPKQKKFEDAVITALGRDFDSVIVDTEKIGAECVQYLKDQRFGPMTFIPLDNIKVNAVNSSMKGLPKARLTIDTIDFDQSLERAMAYACGSSVVCDDLATAKNICYERKMQVKAVTLDGTVIHKAGLMTGGRIADNKGGKRRFEEHDIQNYEKLKDNLLAELESLPRPDRRGGAEEQLQSDLNGLQQRVEYAQAELAAFEQNAASKTKELDFEERQLQDSQPRYDEKSSELEEMQASVEEARQRISEVEDKVFATFCQKLGYENIRSYEAQQGSMEQEASEKRNAFELQKQRLNSKLSWDNGQLEEFESRLSRLQEQSQRMSVDIKSYEDEKAALEDKLDTANAELETMTDKLNEEKSRLTKKNEKVNEARNEVQKRSKNIDVTQRTITAMETEVQRSNAGRYALLRRCKLEQIQIPLEEGSRGLDQLPNDNMLQADGDAMDVDEGDTPEVMTDDYGIEVAYDDLEDELKESNEETMEDQLLDKISTINAELDKLNPNMRAIDRLEGVESRLKSTEKDFEDSRRAAKASRDAFNAIKADRFELFNKAFTHISNSISEVYKDLTRSSTFTTGGSAYLDIEDSDTPYLSGIKYHAMPPLKRFRDMEHLSGGEKSIAALALLFAIHSYQPSPFFVLDEVDAALDNANVEKVRNYIQGHAGPGMQFIVISLKSGLFQGSETLVGVYRDQDANSSNTLTLDLRKYVE